MQSLTYTVVMERNEDGGYTITVPALKGCVTQSHTLAEGLDRVREAIECHIESLVLVRERIPVDRNIVRSNSDPSILKKVAVKIH